MIHVLNAAGEYSVRDTIEPGDVEVSPRPASSFEWDGDAWVEPAPPPEE